MSLSFLPGSLPALQLLLRCAAWIVPSHERAEWLAEWQGELWHAWHMHGREGAGRSSGGRAATLFCLGAFSDALWLRRNNRRSLLRRIFRAGSASRCSILLGAWTAVSLLLCLLLPGARKAIQLSLSREGDSLVTISGAGYSGTQVPTIRVGDYQSWANSKQRVFTEIAFYQPLLRRVHLGNHPEVALSINLASENIFKLLNLPALARTSDRSASLSTAKLLLSEDAWHELFESDPRVIGSVTEIAGQRTVVAGVVSRIHGKYLVVWMPGCLRMGANWLFYRQTRGALCWPTCELPGQRRDGDTCIFTGATEAKPYLTAYRSRSAPGFRFPSFCLRSSRHCWHCRRRRLSLSANIPVTPDIFAGPSGQDNGFSFVGSSCWLSHSFLWLPSTSLMGFPLRGR